MEKPNAAFSDSSNMSPDRGVNKFVRFINVLSQKLSIFAAILSIFMALFTVVDVICRIFFRHSIAGSLEIQQYILSIIVFCALPYTTVQKRHVNIDLIWNHYSPRIKAIFGSVFYLLSAFLFSIICWQNIVRGIIAIEDNEVGVSTGWPLFIFVFVTAFGSGLVAILLVIDFMKTQVEVARTSSSPRLSYAFIYVISILAMASSFILRFFSIDLPPITIGLLGMCSTLGAMVLGMPIAFSLGLFGFLGLWFLSGSDTALQIVRMSTFDAVANYFFCVVPFFVLMGFFCFRAGLSEALYNAGHKIFGALPGGLAIGTVAGCAGFASICGDSMATAGTMGSVAIPEMKKYNYKPIISTSCVAAGGTLGILIPPSMGFIIYGLITEQSIGKLFMAGILPGILLASVFAVIIYFRCRWNPSLGPPGEKVSLPNKARALWKTWPILLLFFIVMGGIYSGITTPTEAGGLGLIVALVLGVINRSIDREKLRLSFFESMDLVSVIFGILIGVTYLGYFITSSEIPMMLSDFVVSLKLSRYFIFIVILFIYLILGMVMNIIPMIMITLPILYPTIAALGFDPIWFGVIMVIMMEMGQITPPVGVNVFVIAGVAKDVPMSTIFKGIVPFAIGMVFVIFILTVFPDIALFLPSTMETLAPIE